MKSKFKRTVSKRSDDPRYTPSYRISEAAHYLGIPYGTIHSWVIGGKFSGKSGKNSYKPVIIIHDKENRLLSFINLVEIHVLNAVRKEHHVTLPKIRKALDYVNENFPIEFPLANEKFETDGINLFIKKYGALINASEEGQMAIRAVMEAHLKRIERDEKGFPIKLYPFTRRNEPEKLRSVVIDPYVSFGRPVLSGTGIATAIIAERFKAGESIDELADDYGRESGEVVEAIRCELIFEAA